MFFFKFRWTHVHFWGYWYPFLDFWWRLLWVSKPGWAALFALGRGVCDICPPRFKVWSSLMTGLTDVYRFKWHSQECVRPSITPPPTLIISLRRHIGLRNTIMWTHLQQFVEETPPRPEKMSNKRRKMRWFFPQLKVDLNLTELIHCNQGWDRSFIT